MKIRIGKCVVLVSYVAYQNLWRSLGLKRFVALSVDLYWNCEPLMSNVIFESFVRSSSAFVESETWTSGIVRRKIEPLLGITSNDQTVPGS